LALANYMYAMNSVLVKRVQTSVS